MIEYLELALLSALANAPLELSRRDNARLVEPYLSYTVQLSIWQYEIAADALYPELRQQGGDPT
jgi:hypothetical protein